MFARPLGINGGRQSDLSKDVDWYKGEERGQGGKWVHVMEEFVGHLKDLGFYSE